MKRTLMILMVTALAMGLWLGWGYALNVTLTKVTVNGVDWWTTGWIDASFPLNNEQGFEVALDFGNGIVMRSGGKLSEHTEVQFAYSAEFPAGNITTSLNVHQPNPSPPPDTILVPNTSITNEPMDVSGEFSRTYTTTGNNVAGGTQITGAYLRFNRPAPQAAYANMLKYNMAFDGPLREYGEIPEPATIISSLLGLAGFALRKFRKV